MIKIPVELQRENTEKLSNGRNVAGKWVSTKNWTVIQRFPSNPIRLMKFTPEAPDGMSWIHSWLGANLLGNWGDGGLLGLCSDVWNMSMSVMYEYVHIHIHKTSLVWDSISVYWSQWPSKTALQPQQPINSSYWDYLPINVSKTNRTMTSPTILKVV